ncbi:putative pentatricopeptide repeat-containing protein, mitochondrial [Trifolium repens]|nr:putative pentatricopeptide repeat-containing protein, mitochondrial [Trifolium repens]
MNANSYRILIFMFCEKGHRNNACKLMKEMVEEKSLKPNLSIYETVLELLRKAGQLKMLEELVDKMVARGFVSFALDITELNQRTSKYGYKQLVLLIAISETKCWFNWL